MIRRESLKEDMAAQASKKFARADAKSAADAEARDKPEQLTLAKDSPEAPKA